MSEINNIHDTFFRETMSHKEVAADFLANYLPAKVLKHIKLDTLAITKDSFVDEKQAEHYSDLLYQIMLSSDRPGFVYFLFEHKSYPDRFVVLQLLRYIIEIWELHLKQNQKAKTLPLIIPIVIYHGKPKGKAIRLSELVDIPDPELSAYVPGFDLAFYDFSPETDEIIKGQILNQLVMLCLQARNTPEDVEKIWEIIALVIQMDENATSMHWLEKIFRYVLSVMDIEPEEMQNMFTQSLSAGKGGMFMTVAERLELRGETRGLQKGRGELLQRQITKRFGKSITDIDVQERLRKATPEQLDLWAERILDAKNVGEVFQDN
ncbi:Rpn family recombination-promoting nuclease/putative transposase [Desulfonatronum thiodismutans]|uniref:Rpn family recombination-promoting nuclease/putative transposase n=1 Tax=Desulfonatronum thiodismutans TaxID=159290 RepID=UPI0006917AE8|nr:Rpn family recombination-promoting nuclease/putative transposase [Desulfonatronum thiodismutans]